jgi:hypothetical protein
MGSIRPSPDDDTTRCVTTREEIPMDPIHLNAHLIAMGFRGTEAERQRRLEQRFAGSSRRRRRR